MLPEKKGTDILIELRGEENLTPKTKIVILTNFEQDDESRIAMENKAEAYLIKAEITPKKLLKVVEALLADH